MELTPEVNPFVESNLLANARITGEPMANMLNDWTQVLISCTFASAYVDRGAKGLFLSMGREDVMRAKGNGSQGKALNCLC